MSWQNYVDQQLIGSGCVSKAIIAGHDGTLWAKSENIEYSKDEMVKLVTSFPPEEQLKLAMTGVYCGSEKYIYLSGSESVIRCKKGKQGFHAMKTKQAVLVAIFDEPIQHPQVASVVENLGEYLISQSY